MRRTLALLVLAVTAAAQQPQAPRQVRRPSAEAARLARQLELDERRAAAADQLLALGADAVPALLRASRHPDREVAHRALQVLAELGHDGLSAVPELERRAAGKGPTNAADARACAFALSQLPRYGSWLVASYQQNTVYEVRDGATVWQSPKRLGGCWSVQGLPDDRMLVTGFDGGWVREYSRAGEILWEYAEITAPHVAQRLLSGRTLVTDFAGSRIVEVDREGQVVWQAPVPHPIHVRRLASGHTLVCCYQEGRVVELDGDGAEVWRVEGLGKPYSARRLPDGTTLVVCNSSPAALRRFDRDGREVATEQLEPGTITVVPLPDGRLMARLQTLTRTDADGAALWQLELDGTCGPPFAR